MTASDGIFCELQVPARPRDATAGCISVRLPEPCRAGRRGCCHDVRLRLDELHVRSMYVCMCVCTPCCKCDRSRDLRLYYDRQHAHDVCTGCHLREMGIGKGNNGGMINTCPSPSNMHKLSVCCRDAEERRDEVWLRINSLVFGMAFRSHRRLHMMAW